MQAIQIGVVRDGHKKLSVVAGADVEPWDGLPVWLASKSPRSSGNFSLTR